MSGVDVTGGSHGVAADLDAVRELAAAFGRAGHETLRSALALHAYLVDPDIGMVTPFDPAGVAAFEFALGGALDGPTGLSWGGARCEALDVLLRASAAAYQGVDTLDTEARDAVLGLVEAPAALAYLAWQLAETRDPGLALQRAVTTFPELADVLVPAALDLSLAAAGLPPDPQLAAHVMPDGHAVVVPRGGDGGADATAPRDLADVVAGLARRNDAADGDHGEIDVRFVTHAGGSRSVIVDVTGTKSWTPGRTPDITSLATNGRALYGERTSYEQGVLTAMHDAGVTADDDVMIVGHSEGGMVAVTTARDAVESGQFHVTHVVTAGSPIGDSAASVPRSVDVLALENDRDVVPHLDGRANPDRVNVTTVRAAHGNGTVGNDHSLEHGYLPLAKDTDASTDPSVRDYLAGCDDFFDGTGMSTERYQVVRGF